MLSGSGHIISFILLYREYASLKGQRWKEQEAFRLECRRRRPPVQAIYPLELSEFPSFVNWLRTRVKTAQRARQVVHDDII